MLALALQSEKETKRSTLPGHLTLIKSVQKQIINLVLKILELPSHLRTLSHYFVLQFEPSELLFVMLLNI